MRVIAIALFVTLTVVSATAQFKLYEKGIDAYQAKDYPNAISLLNEYLDKTTRDKAFDVEVRYYVALSYFKTQYYTSSVREFDKALQLGHKNVGNINWFMAKAYAELKANKESIECYSKAIDLIKDPTNQAKLYQERATQYEKQGSSALVISDLNQSLALDKNNADATQMLERLTTEKGSRGFGQENVKADKKTGVAQTDKEASKIQPVNQTPAKPNAPGETAVLLKEPKTTDTKSEEPKKSLPTSANENKVQNVVPPPSTVVVQKEAEKKPNAEGALATEGKVQAGKQLSNTQQPVVTKTDEKASPAPAPAIPAQPTLADEYKDEKRYALVIGNSSYKFVQPLKNASNDANDMAAELQNSNFEVIKVIDGDYIKMRDAFRKFNELLNNGPKDQTVGLFYYAGHGLQNEGENYLVPIDADVKYDDDIPRMCLPMQRVVLANMERSSTRMNIVVMDACRNNPFPSSSRSTGNAGLAEIKRAKGSFIAYATAPGSTASDGTGRNGLYTQELLKAMKRPGRTIESVFKEVRYNVLKLSDEKQNTWDSSNIIGDFYFKF
ncbi:MAG: caspase family protein [Bacteroidetes bacterium]|nr:caspase family protein [Bacteroidota bacterium]